MKQANTSQLMHSQSSHKEYTQVNDKKHRITWREGGSSRTVTKDDLANETVEGRGDEQHGAANVRVTSAGCPD